MILIIHTRVSQKTVLGEISSVKMAIISPKLGSAMPVYLEKALEGCSLAGRCLGASSTTVLLQYGCRKRVLTLSFGVSSLLAVNL